MAGRGAGTEEGRVRRVGVLMPFAEADPEGQSSAPPARLAKRRKNAKIRVTSGNPSGNGAFTMADYRPNIKYVEAISAILVQFMVPRSKFDFVDETTGKTVDGNKEAAIQVAETEIFTETSDEFFAQRRLNSLLDGKSLDLVFIDGLHLFEQVLKASEKQTQKGIGKCTGRK